MEEDKREPLPRKSIKPSITPALQGKEKKSREDTKPKENKGTKLNLRPKAKVNRPRSRSRSKEKRTKEKKRTRSRSPSILAGGDRGVSSRGTEREQVTRSSSAFAPPDSRSKPKKNKGVKKELKNERYWERRRQQLWEEQTRGHGYRSAGMPPKRRPAPAAVRRGVLRRPARPPVALGDGKRRER